MKILLFSLNASRSHTNLAIRCLQQSLSENGFSDVSLLERTEKDRSHETLAALFEANADLYGFSTYIWNRKAHLTLAENLKKLRPMATIVFGGPEVSYHTDAFLEKYPFVDSVIAGEGEEAIVEAATILGQGKPLPKEMIGRPYPKFADTVISYRENERKGNILYYESSRGCPFRCAYCLSGAEEHKAIRAKTLDDVKKDLLAFETLENVKIIKFIDRTFNFNISRAKAIWRELLNDSYTKSYHFEIAASLLDAESFSILQAFPKGKIQLEIGLQSTDPKVLAAIRRRDDSQTVLSALERLMSFRNMHIHADLICGLPLDTMPSIAKSFDDLFGKCHMLQLGFLKLLDGSPLYEEIDTYGYLFHTEPPYEVLSSNTLSFSEITRLKALDAILDRTVNSGRFANAMVVLTRDRSPFDTLLALSSFVGDPQSLSQKDLYLSLWRFEALQAESRLAEMEDALLLDFLLNEQGRPTIGFPYTLLSLTHEEKRTLSKKHPMLYIPATECYRLHSGQTVAVDRMHKIMKLL